MPETPASLNRPGVLRFGEWVVYPRLCRATRAGVPVHVRSQVIDLLAVLARRPNTITLKEDVMEALWPGVHVSGSALSRCLAELRQVFDDDAKRPWLIETISKRGYRLIADVAVEEQDPDEQALAVVGEDENAEGRNPREQDAIDADASTWWRVPVWGWIAASVTGVAVILGLSWWVYVSRQPGQPWSERGRVVLADVVNTTGDKAFDGTIRLALAIQLEQAPFLRIVSDERVRETLSLMRKPANEPVTGSVALEVCRRETSAVVLGGSIVRLGRRYAMGVEAIECRQGETIARVIEEADTPEQVLDAVGRVASILRAKLGESPESLKVLDVPVTRATTASLEALRALSLGDAKRDEGQFSEALEYYRQATAIDREFAIAWARQGTVLVSEASWQEAADAFTTAYQLADRTSAPERYYITANYHLNVTGRADLALEALLAWKRLHPGSAAASMSLASLYVNTFGRYDDALRELRDVEPQVAKGAAFAWNRACALVALGRVSEAKQLLRDTSLGSEFDLAAGLWRAQVAWLEGDAKALQVEVEQAAAHGGGQAYLMLMARDEMAMVEGRPAESRRLCAAAVELATTFDSPSAVAFPLLAHALAEAAVGYSAEAGRSAAAGLRLARNRDTYLRAAMALALAGQRRDARRAYDQARAASPFSTRQDPVWMTVVGAAVEGIDRPADAVAQLNAIVPLEQGREFSLIPLILRAHLLERAGKPRESIEACRLAIRLRGVKPASPMFPLLKVTLARALAASGDVDASRAEYESFFETWRAADPGVPLLRDARAEYALLRR